MVQVNDRVIEEILGRSQNLLLEEVVALIEREHAHEAPGLARETLDAYADVLGGDAAIEFDPDEFLDAIDDRLTEAETWAGSDVFYAVADDRVSVYPQYWHEALGGTVDLPAYLRFLQDEVVGVEEDFTSGAAGSGVPENSLIKIVSIVGQADPATVKTRLETLRDEGELAEDADQHPEARVQLRHRDDRRDPSL